MLNLSNYDYVYLFKYYIKIFNMYTEFTGEQVLCKFNY